MIRRSMTPDPHVLERSYHRAVTSPWLLALDVLVVLVFVVVGRRTHDEAETLAGILRTATPFLVGLAAGWVTTAAWRRPTALFTGIGVLTGTLIVGMAVRRAVFGDGIAMTFIAVAAAFLALGFVGWRVVALALRQRSRVQAGG